MEEDRDDLIIENPNDPIYQDIDDPIIEEIRAIREAHAARFNYDLKAIFEDLYKKQEESGYEILRIAPRRRHDSDPSPKDEEKT